MPTEVGARRITLARGDSVSNQLRYLNPKTRELMLNVLDACLLFVACQWNQGENPTLSEKPHSAMTYDSRLWRVWYSFVWIGACPKNNAQ
jgi:hypothetical protein